MIDDDMKSMCKYRGKINYATTNHSQESQNLKFKMSHKPKLKFIHYIMENSLCYSWMLNARAPFLQIICSLQYCIICLSQILWMQCIKYLGSMSILTCVTETMRTVLVGSKKLVDSFFRKKKKTTKLSSFCLIWWCKCYTGNQADYLHKLPRSLSVQLQKQLMALSP